VHEQQKRVVLQAAACTDILRQWNCSANLDNRERTKWTFVSGQTERATPSWEKEPLSPDVPTHH
jgi:hypothetical protein